MDDAQKLVQIETILSTMAVQQTELMAAIKEYSKDFQTHLQHTAVFNERLQRVESGVGKHSEELYGIGQLVYKVKTLEGFQTNANKIFWEIARPILALIGVGLVVLIGIFGVIFYSMQDLIQALAK